MYKYNKKDEQYKIEEKDGLLEFSEELPFLNGCYIAKNARSV